LDGYARVPLRARTIGGEEMSSSRSWNYKLQIADEKLQIANCIHAYAAGLADVRIVETESKSRPAAR
jgi:hypothetical protein